MLLVDLPCGRRLVVDIVLAGADEAAARLSNGVLSVADSRGRRWERARRENGGEIGSSVGWM